MKNIRKWIFLILTAAAVWTAASPLKAENIEWDEKMTVYLGGGVTGFTYEIMYLNFDHESFKSTNPDVASLYTVEVHEHNHEFRYENTDDAWQSDQWRYAVFNMDFSTPGKTHLFFNPGSDWVEEAVLSVRKYTNPVSELTIPGIKGGKNLASAFNKKRNAVRKMTTDGKKGNIVVKAAPGWRIQSVRLKNMKNGSYWGRRFYQAKSCKLALRSALKKSGNYQISIVMQNYKNKGLIYLEYSIGS